MSKKPEHERSFGLSQFCTLECQSQLFFFRASLFVNFRPLFKRIRVMILFLYNFYLSQPEVNIEEVISTFLKLAVSHALMRNFVYD